jgi:D-alanine-D-alanine ligase
MKVCVLQPDYSTTNVDYKYYDPPRDLTELLPHARVDHVFLNKLTTYSQLKDLSKKGYDIFVNLCEGYLEWEVPSIDVIHTLDLLNLPYTGPNATLYDPPKPLMKYVAYCAGVKTPLAVEVGSIKDIDDAILRLRFPMFVKPAKAGDSLGVDEHSKVNTPGELKAKVTALLDVYDEILIEEYVDGREFTVLVAAIPDGKGKCSVYKPVEYVFPEGRSFKTYALKTSELHPDCNVPCDDFSLEHELRSAAEKVFVAFGGVGYARMDFRMDKDGELYFLEINFTCSAFYVDGYEGSADFVLNNDPAGKRGFLRQIIAEGVARHRAKQKKYSMKGSPVSGYGIFANRTIQKDEVVFAGEGLSQRIISKRYVDAHWNEKQKMDFKHYAYPIGKDVYILWDDRPENWAPQNHSCTPNTAYDGLNVVAVRDIAKGEELTVDYAMFIDESMEPFKCQCGSVNCREIIFGVKENAVARIRLAQ